MYNEEDLTVPHVTRNDSVKAALYAFFGLMIAISLIAVTVWMFTAG